MRAAGAASRSFPTIADESCRLWEFARGLQSRWRMLSGTLFPCDRGRRGFPTGSVGGKSGRALETLLAAAGLPVTIPRLRSGPRSGGRVPGDRDVQIVPAAATAGKSLSGSNTLLKKFV